MNARLDFTEVSLVCSFMERDESFAVSFKNNLLLRTLFTLFNSGQVST